MKDMKNVFNIAVSILFCFIASASAVNQTSTSFHAEGRTGAIQNPTAWQTPLQVEEWLSSMSLREKVGQLFFIRPEALDLGSFENAAVKSGKAPALALTEEMEEYFGSYPAGGIVLFGSNCVDSVQLRCFTSALHALPYRPLICVDEEGGRVLRIGGKQAFGTRRIADMSTLASRGEVDVTDAVRYICSYLEPLGIDVDFAPVADVNSNPDNPVIGTRAFSSDAAVPARMVEIAVRTFLECGIFPCIKHFPGHGDTSTDTHKGYAASSKTWSEMLSCEMLPFRSGIQAGVPMVMISHITAPAVDPSCVPSTFSSMLIKDKLRDELGFGGVIVTDSMGMGAVTGSYSSGEAAVLAILAGVDVVLCPLHYDEAFEAVLAAVASGRIPLARLDESVRRILTLKFSL